MVGGRRGAAPLLPPPRGRDGTLNEKKLLKVQLSRPSGGRGCPRVLLPPSRVREETLHKKFKTNTTRILGPSGERGNVMLPFFPRNVEWQG